MPTPILATKLYLPLPRPDGVRRTRLVQRLEAGANRPGQRLTLISAPVGFGKTTLVSEWVAEAVRAMGLVIVLFSATAAGWYMRPLATRLSPQPVRTYEQPLRLHNHVARTVLPTTYVFCTNKPADSMVTHMTHDGRHKAQSRGWRYFELPTDHKPEREAPDDLAAILVSLAPA